jgi:uncharacterized protein (DUF488 family)
MDSVSLATIGFTRSTAERFFQRLIAADVTKVIDVRLHNTSQLAGFAKAEDLAYLLGKIGGIGYVHEPLLAPTDDMLRAYRKEKGDWTEYRTHFLDLMTERKIEDRLKPDTLAGACLLCSEATPDRCHRMLVCEYLNGKWGGRLKVRHL